MGDVSILHNFMCRAITDTFLLRRSDRYIAGGL
nr:MAG TPA: hypothetical protein [Caudoviricetes sp.]DAP41591.1 MAG TPA: hypothetical protein [Caudoviricetes sp.]DAT55426.1 MAG TPA: hypothetical protein [Caudoviricetes sp.]DAZ56973.1 MAG TPA: hypothetical protein [Caudoviricetes sp.]